MKKKSKLAYKLLHNTVTCYGGDNIMTKCIFYCIVGLGMFATPGCFAGYDTVRSHRVVHTTHLPDVYVTPVRRYNQRVVYHHGHPHTRRPPVRHRTTRRYYDGNGNLRKRVTTRRYHPNRRYIRKRTTTRRYNNRGHLKKRTTTRRYR